MFLGIRENRHVWAVRVSLLAGTLSELRMLGGTLDDADAGGSIIFTSSVAGLRGLPFLGHYVASKHGITGLAKTMASELGQYNIRVNTIHPHGVETGMQMTDMRPLIDANAHTLGPIFMQTLPDPAIRSARR